MEEVCTICLQSKHITTKLCDCQAYYHIHCWNKWINLNNDNPTCPTCRREVSIELNNENYDNIYREIYHNDTYDTNYKVTQTILLYRKC